MHRCPVDLRNGAGDEIRTRDLNLGKVSLYQLSHSRMPLNLIYHAEIMFANRIWHFFEIRRKLHKTLGRSTVTTEGFRRLALAKGLLQPSNQRSFVSS